MPIEYINTPEIHRLFLMIGAIASIIYKNTYNVLPGGIIVPGLLIIAGLASPIWLLTLGVITIIIDVIYRRFFMRTYALPRISLYILGFMSLTLGGLMSFLYINLGIIHPEVDTLVASFCPAVICHVMIRQNRQAVLKGIAICVSTSLILFSLIYFIFGYFFNADFAAIYLTSRGKEHIDVTMYPFALAATLMVSYVIYRFKNIRSGGYLIAPFITALLISPVGSYLFFIGFFIVRSLTQLICHLTLTIGLDRYALTLCLSTIYVWGIDLIFLNLDSSILPFLGSGLLVILALMSYVNDSILYADKNIYYYMGISIAIAWLVDLIFDFIIEPALL